MIVTDLDGLALARLQVVSDDRCDMLIGCHALFDVALEVRHHGNLHLEVSHLIVIEVLEDQSP
jgi:hypothetical protein